MCKEFVSFFRDLSLFCCEFLSIFVVFILFGSELTLFCLDLSFSFAESCLFCCEFRCCAVCSFGFAVTCVCFAVSFFVVV